MGLRRHAGTWLVLGCFFASGTAGLVYEVLWVRMIDRIMGSAPYAVAAVLTVFMGGLALGGFLLGRLVERFKYRHTLLAVYGSMELAIGFYALILPSAIGATTPLYRLIYDRLQDHSFVYPAVAFFGCAVLLLLPTTLMGGTLPVLCRYYVRESGHLGQRAGLLYGLNTVGAALGTVLCGFVLIPRIGLNATLCSAACLNIVAGSICLLASRTGNRESSTPETGIHLSLIDRPKNLSGPQPLMMMALSLFAVSGFSSMACQVFWTRLIGLLIGPTHYSFTLVVATFIVGLALGSMVFGRLADRVRDPFKVLILTQAGAAVFGLVSSQLLGSGQFFFAKLIHAYHGGFSGLLWVQTFSLATVLLIPTVFWGAAFPLVARIVTGGREDMGRTIGTAYAINTIGAILGSFAAGFILVPLIGKQKGLALVFLIQFSAALVCFALREFEMKRPVFRLVPLSAMILSGILASVFFPSWDRTLLSRGWYRDFEALKPRLVRTSWFQSLMGGAEQIRSLRQGIEVVFYGEGAGGFTTVEKETTSTGVVEYAMFNSGKADASSHGDRSTQTLSGHIPLMFHPGAKQVMVLGLASGMTPGEVLHYPVKELDILEINDQVVRACGDFFSEVNNRCLDDPRTRVIVQDGRNHLAMTRQTYDVIISEPSNPWMAGLANLYTQDFFSLVKTRLTGRGLFAQWIQSYEMDWDTFALLGRTFASVFPKGAMMKIGPVDYLLIGSADDRELDWELARRNLGFAQKSSLAVFKGIDFLAHLMVTEDLPVLFGQGPVHTDDLPRLEFSAPRHLYDGHLDIERRAGEKRRLTRATAQILEKNKGPEAMLDFMAFCASVNAPLFSALDFKGLSPDHRQRYLDIVCDFCRRESIPTYSMFHDAEPKALCAFIQSKRIMDHMEKGGVKASDHYNLALALIASGQTARGAEELEKTWTMDPFHRDAFFASGLICAENGQWDRAALCFAKASILDPSWARAHLFLGMTRSRMGRWDEALDHLNKAVSLDSSDGTAFNERGALYLRLDRPYQALDDFKKALLSMPDDPELLNNMAMACVKTGDLIQARDCLSQALRIRPYNGDMRYNLAVVTARLGKRT